MGKTKTSEFNKVLGACDVLVIAFGAMIGWGWVVSTGDWIMNGGIIGAMLGFVIGGLMVFFVGLTYAELTSAMPQCGGEHVFSFKAMGAAGSFICTWAIVMGYVSVVCFEACALPTIITYIYPDFLQGYLYSVEGFDIYASWLAVAVLVAVFITYVNIIGTKTAAILQTILTVGIGGVGILLIAAAVITGTEANLEGQAFMGFTTGDMVKGTLAVAVMTPFYFIGFDVIPQAAEEISISLKKIGRILILSIVLAVAFYALIILGVGLVMTNAEIGESMKGVGGLVTADAMAVAFGSSAMAKVLIIGGLCGIVTSWNSFLIGGSRAMYSMAASYMIPQVFAKLHRKYKTPVNALLLIGILSIIAPLFGRKMLVWVVDAGNFGCCVAYCMVAISFIILRKKQPDMPRPYKVKHYRFIGAMAVIMSGFMVVMYIIPGSGATLVPQEWAMVLLWSAIGGVFAVYGKVKYKENFATHIDVVSDEVLAQSDAAFGYAMETALRDVRSEGPAEYAVQPIDFSFNLPVRLVFGAGHIRQAGQAAKAYSSSALIVTDEEFMTSRSYEELTAGMKDAGLSFTVFSKIGPKADDAMVKAMIGTGRSGGCGVVVAVGGNTVMNCAKCAAYGLAHGDLESDRPAKDVLPIVSVPLHIDMAQGYSGSLVYTNRKGERRQLRHAGLMPDVVIADPACTAEAVGRNIGAEGFSALVSGVDAYMGERDRGLSDVITLYGVSLLSDHIIRAYADTTDTEAWEKVVLGGVVTSLISTEQSFMAELKKVSAQSSSGAAVLAAAVPAFLSEVCREDVFRYGKLARTLGGFTAEDCGSRLETIARKLELYIPPADKKDAEQIIKWTEDCVRRWKEQEKENRKTGEYSTAWLYS